MDYARGIDGSHVACGIDTWSLPCESRYCYRICHLRVERLISGNIGVYTSRFLIGFLRELFSQSAFYPQSFVTKCRSIFRDTTVGLRTYRKCDRASWNEILTQAMVLGLRVGFDSYFLVFPVALRFNYLRRCRKRVTPWHWPILETEAEVRNWCV